MRYASLIAAAVLLASALSCSYSPPGRCGADADCPLGLVCAEGVCSGCSKNSECHIWQECSAGNTCVAMEGMCGIDEDCGPGEKCADDHSCVPCPDGDCTIALPDGNDPFIGGSGSGGEMYLYGTLQEGSSARDVLCNLSAPNTVYAAFVTYSWGMVHRMADGRFLYKSTVLAAQPQLRMVTGESVRFASDGTYQFPPAPQDNDTVVPTPACDNAGGIYDFEVHPAGRIWYSCRNDPEQYFEGTEKKSTKGCYSGGFVAIGNDSSVLCSEGAVIDSSGARHPVQPSHTFHAVRSKPGGGFWVVYDMGDHFERWTISGDASSTRDGSYAPVPDGYSASSWGVLDSQGRWYRFADRRSDPGPDLFIRSDFGSSTVVYDEAKKPRCRYHASYLVPPT